MKCPKCRYLSFEPELRCKHCGYDFSLAEPNLAVRTFDELEQQDPDPPLVDLQLRAMPSALPASRQAAASIALADREEALAPRPAVAARPAAVPRPAALPKPAAVPAPVRPAPGPTPDLPLFIKPKEVSTLATASRAEALTDDIDEPAVRVPAAPRPLVVRRRAPDSGRHGGPVVAATAPALVVNRADRDLLEYLRRVETEAAPAAFPSGPVAVAVEDAVGVATRFKALTIDVLLLALLDVAVVLLTLRQCDLGVSQWAGMPLVPLSAFLVSLSVSYLLMFNVVGGQTIGKMICGLRVVGDQIDARAAPTFRQLSSRALLSVPSLLLLGAGFLPYLAGQDRTVHDRLTHTRVVRA
jgi:uncharacterized RDD family membrane protein YckC